MLYLYTDTLITSPAFALNDNDEKELFEKYEFDLILVPVVTLYTDI